MRRWIVLALIVLLPLRAWAGALMTSHDFAIDLIATDAVSTRAQAPIDTQDQLAAMPCHGHADAAPAGPGAAGAEEPKGEPACNTCQVCHLSALSGGAVWHPARQDHQALPCAAASRFATVPVAPGDKPPIY